MFGHVMRLDQSRLNKNIWLIITSDIPQFERGYIWSLMRLDQLRASKNIWWVIMQNEVNILLRLVLSRNFWEKIDAVDNG